jgi:small GTP-binding protein
MTTTTRPDRHKIILIGPPTSGKTSLIHRYAHGNFHERGHLSTIGTAFHVREVDTAFSRVVLNIWDTAGMEKHSSLVPKYSKGASAAVVVFDVADAVSYENAKGLLIDAPNACDTALATFFVANKIDCEWAVDAREARDFAEQQRATFVETSAKTGENVRELFDQIASRVARERELPAGINIGPSRATDGKYAGEASSAFAKCC